MIGTAHDVGRTYRQQKGHENRAFLKLMGMRVLAHRHRRRALRRSLKLYRV